MKAEYQDWIATNCPEPYGKCAEYTQAMAAAFPELRRVRGYYLCIVWGVRQHWWLVAPDGSIVDPTVDQFPSKGRGTYDELRPGDPVPTGVCMDCGETVYDGATFCDAECEAATRRYLERERRR